MKKIDNLTERMRGILKNNFEEARIDVSLSGIKSNIHIVVMSRFFDYFYFYFYFVFNFYLYGFINFLLKKIKEKY